MKILLEKIESRLSTFFYSPKKRWLFFILLIIFSTSIVILRRPDAVTNPQFYAEDGTLWYSEAYNNGLISPLFMPQNGYFQTISRIGAAISQYFSLYQAPLVLNVLAILIQILPVVFLLSSRFDRLIPSHLFRIMIGLVYLFLPHAKETHANITNAQWRLAILMFLVIIAAIPKNIYWKIFDYLILLVAALSGPFSILLLPVFLLHQYFSKEKKPIHLAIVSVAAVIQLISSYFTLSEGRSHAPLGTNFLLFFKIISGQIFVAGLLGSDFFSYMQHLALWNSGLLPVAIGISGFSMIGYAFWKSTLELRLFIIFAALILAAALVTPQVSLDKPQWEIMAATSGNRYYLFPIIAWILAIIWIFIKSTSKSMQTLAGILFALFLFWGIPKDFHYKPFIDTKYFKQVNEFKALPSGTSFDFKICPKGWKMNLKKK